MKVRAQSALWGLCNTIKHYTEGREVFSSLCALESLIYLPFRIPKCCSLHKLTAVCWGSSCLLPPQASFSCLYLYIKWAFGKIPGFLLLCFLCSVSMRSFPLWRWHGWEMAHCSNRRQKAKTIASRVKQTSKWSPRQRAGKKNVHMWYEACWSPVWESLWEHKK